MTFTVVGSGFGLYGYVPALIELLGEKVVLPERYRARLEQRPELERYRDAITWAGSAEAAWDAATGVVIATAPGEQPGVVARARRAPRISTIVLEKPIAVTAHEAAEVLGELDVAQIRYRVAYTLPHTRWGETLDLSNEGGSSIDVSWKFMAHHFAHDVPTWKREHGRGGGVIRFYGIHLLALLAKHGYHDVSCSIVSGRSPEEPERWRATLLGPGLAECRLDVDSRAPAGRFEIRTIAEATMTTLVDLPEPFHEETAPGGGDRRIGVLMRFLQSLESSNAPHYAWYSAVNALWARVDATTRYASAAEWARMAWPPV